MACGGNAAKYKKARENIKKNAKEQNTLSKNAVVSLQAMQKIPLADLALMPNTRQKTKAKQIKAKNSTGINAECAIGMVGMLLDLSQKKQQTREQQSK